MIISKKLKKKFFVEKLIKFLNKIIFNRRLFLLILVTGLIYYYQSGFSNSNPQKY